MMSEKRRNYSAEFKREAVRLPCRSPFPSSSASAIIAAPDRWHAGVWASRSQGLVDPHGRWSTAVIRHYHDRSGSSSEITSASIKPPRRSAMRLASHKMSVD